MPSTDSALPWVGVIPARYGSSRFPGKPLAPIAGVPMVIRVAGRVSRVPGLDRVLVATDDDRIEETCRDEDVEVVRTRSDCMTGTDRVWEAVRDLGDCRVINVQGDEPLVDPGSIRKVMDAKLEHPDSVINGQAPVEDLAEARRPSVPKMVAAPDGRLLYASRAPVPARHSDDELHAPGDRYRKQVCIYAFDREQLKLFGERSERTPLEELEDIEVLRFLEVGVPVRVVDLPAGTVAVDHPEDVETVERLLDEDGER